VFAGAAVGTRISHRFCGDTLKRVFAVVMISVAALMFLKAVGVLTSL
jgi:uncharacterized membrane protein YfcA